MARKDANVGAAERAAERARQALEYRKARASYRLIADKLGISVGQAYADVKNALAEVREAVQETAEELVQLEFESLDTAAVAIAPRVAKGELGAIDRWVKLSESRRKLMGLDKPTKLAHTNPDGDEEFSGGVVRVPPKLGAEEWQQHAREQQKIKEQQQTTAQSAPTTAPPAPTKQPSPQAAQRPVSSAVKPSGKPTAKPKRKI